jgi:hypothetical protein
LSLVFITLFYFCGVLNVAFYGLIAVFLRNALDLLIQLTTYLVELS